MHKGLGQAVPKPCSKPAPGPMCTIMVSLQPSSIVTILVSESVWGRYIWPHFAVSEHPPSGSTGASLRGRAAYWSRCASLPTWRQAVWVMWVPRLSLVYGPHFPGMRAALVPFCVLRAAYHSTQCPSPVGHLGLRLGRGHFSVTGLPCFPPPELPRSSSSGDIAALHKHALA